MRADILKLVIFSISFRCLNILFNITTSLFVKFPTSTTVSFSGYSMGPKCSAALAAVNIFFFGGVKSVKENFWGVVDAIMSVLWGFDKSMQNVMISIFVDAIQNLSKNVSIFVCVGVCFMRLS